MAYWALQANPSRYRILQAALDRDETTWTANRYADQIKVGDTALIWLSGPWAGGYALGEITATATLKAEDAALVPYWKNPEDAQKVVPRIRLRLTRRMYFYPILRKACIKDPLLSQMLIIRQPAGTIFSISKDQFMRIQEIVASRPEEWSRHEYIMALDLHFESYWNAQDDSEEQADPEAEDEGEEDEGEEDDKPDSIPQDDDLPGTPAAKIERLARFIDRNAEDVRSIVNGFDSLARHDAVDQPDIVSSSHAPEPRSGTVDVSDIQKAIWHEFSSRPEEVRRIAFDIRKTALGAGIEPQREIPWPIPLTLVRQLEEIVKSVDQFNRQAGIAPELVRELLRSTSFWVFSPATGDFGPSKFVGYAGIDFSNYEAAAKQKISGGAKFEGHVARMALEGVLGTQFTADPQMADLLRAWGQSLAGAEIFDGVAEDSGKWEFLALPAPDCRYWKIAPGEKAAFWKDNRDAGIIAIGWGQAGDPRTRSKEDLEAHYTKVFKYTKDQAQNAVRAVWWFIREIKPGDIIVANRGQSTVTGRGVVLGPAEFRADRGEWSNCLPVHWFDTNERTIPRQKSWFTTILPMGADAYDALFPVEKGTPAIATAANAPFEVSVIDSNVAALAVGNTATARGELNMPGLTIHNPQTVIIAGAVSTATDISNATVRAQGSKPVPSYQDDETRLLSQKLAAAQARRQTLQEHGRDTAEVLREILDIKRRLRDGGQLRAGDSLGRNGRYELLDLLGRGGFASVWLAYDTARSDQVAIKVLHSNLAGDRVRLDRFKRGARIMSELRHHAVVRVLEPYGEDQGWHYFVMEHLSGGDLRQAVLAKRVTAAQAMQSIVRVSEAVAEAHKRCIVHRDIKPANILLDAVGAPKLTDFDLAAASDTTGGTRTGALGTFMYSAPELMSSPSSADATADVFSLGMTAAFILGGIDLPMGLVGRPNELIEQLECSLLIKDVLRRSTNWSNPRSRYADAQAFRNALLQALSGPSPDGDLESASPERVLARNDDPRARYIIAEGAVLKWLQVVYASPVKDAARDRRSYDLVVDTEPKILVQIKLVAGDRSVVRYFRDMLGQAMLELAERPGSKYLVVVLCSDGSPTHDAVDEVGERFSRRPHPDISMLLGHLEQDNFVLDERWWDHPTPGSSSA